MPLQSQQHHTMHEEASQPTSSIEFIKAKDTARKGSELDDYKQIASIKEEETQILKDLYIPKEEEGLHRFEEALTKLPEYENRVAQSQELKDLNTVISETNKKLQMRFKREHEYKLEKYEEKLYKEVVYDLRPDHNAAEEVIVINPLKKAKHPAKIRNINDAAYIGYKQAQWPMHQRRPHIVVNMHEGGQLNKDESSKLIDPYYWTSKMTEEELCRFNLDEQLYYQMC